MDENNSFLFHNQTRHKKTNKPYFAYIKFDSNIIYLNIQIVLLGIVPNSVLTGFITDLYIYIYIYVCIHTLA